MQCSPAGTDGSDVSVTDWHAFDTAVAVSRLKHGEIVEAVFDSDGGGCSTVTGAVAVDIGGSTTVNGELIADGALLSSDLVALRRLPTD